MAIITPDSTCAICERPFDFEQEPIFATWGVFAVPPELFRFCDAPLHWGCYATWSHRAVFAAAYFQMWVEIAREDAFWSQVWLDEKLLVTVNPDEPVAEVSLRLAEIGSVFRVKLADWTSWLAAQCHSPQGNHPIETAALAAILPTRRQPQRWVSSRPHRDGGVSGDLAHLANASAHQRHHSQSY